MGFFFSGGRCWLPRLIWSFLAGDGFFHSDIKSIKHYFARFVANHFSLSLSHAFCDGPSYFVFFCDVSVVPCSMQLLSSEFSFFLYRYPHGYCYAHQAITTGSDQSSCDIKDVVNNDFDSLEMNEWLCRTTTATQLRKTTDLFMKPDQEWQRLTKRLIDCQRTHPCRDSQDVMWCNTNILFHQCQTSRNSI